MVRHTNSSCKRNPVWDHRLEKVSEGGIDNKAHWAKFVRKASDWGSGVWVIHS